LLFVIIKILSISSISFIFSIILSIIGLPPIFRSGFGWFNVIGYNLVELREKNLISYESVSSEDFGWAKYEWIEGKKTDKLNKLTKRVAKYIQENKVSEYRKISEDLGGENEARISCIVSNLERQGFVKPIKWYRNTNKSKVEILKDGKEFFEEYIIPIKNALKNKEELKEMEDVLHYFENDSIDRISYCNTAMDLYEKVSPNLNKKSAEERKLEILGIINWFDSGKGARPKEVEEKLGMKPGIYIKPLLDEGLIYKEKEGMATYYFLTEEGMAMV